MVKTRGGTDKSQSWLTFLRNHLEVSWAMDFFTVPTLRFQILYLRRELLAHVIVLNEEHLKRLLKEFIEEYYHLARPHQGLNGDTPVPTAKPEPAADVSRLVSIPVVGGLHHRSMRVAA